MGPIKPDVTKYDTLDERESGCISYDGGFVAEHKIEIGGVHPALSGVLPPKNIKVDLDQ